MNKKIRGRGQVELALCPLQIVRNDMRRLLFAIAALLISVWLLSGCAPAGDTSAAGAGTPSAAQSTGGTRAVKSTPGEQKTRRAQGKPQPRATAAAQTNPEAGQPPRAAGR